MSIGSHMSTNLLYSFFFLTVFLFFLAAVHSPSLLEALIVSCRCCYNPKPFTNYRGVADCWLFNWWSWLVKALTIEVLLNVGCVSVGYGR
jgi:hypothetical protein